MIETFTLDSGIRRGSGFSQTFPSLAAGESIDIIDPMSMEQLLDEELVARYRSATQADEREEYINQLFRRNYSKVARWCLRFTDDREAAADLAQEIFVKVYQSLTSFQGQSKFSTWLFVIARNHCLNAVRADAREATTLAEDDAEDILLEIADSSPTPYTHAERASFAKMVRELLNEALDETEKKVFTLHYGDDLPLDAITRLLGLENQSGAKAFIVSAKRKLARLSQQWKARGQYKGI
jgi:RNA polymerase sigma factor (sigma-70 family)